MGLLEAIREEEKIIIPISLGLPTLRLMGVVQRTSIGGYALVETSFDVSGKDNDEPTETTNAPPEEEPMDTEVDVTA